MGQANIIWSILGGALGALIAFFCSYALGRIQERSKARNAAIVCLNRVRERMLVPKLTKLDVSKIYRETLPEIRDVVLPLLAHLCERCRAKTQEAWNEYRLLEPERLEDENTPFAKKIHQEMALSQDKFAEPLEYTQWMIRRAWLNLDASLKCRGFPLSWWNAIAQFFHC